MILKEWTDNQRRVFIDSSQVYEAFQDAFQRNRTYRGGMHWKKSGGREYLFRSVDRYGNGKSLGPRTSETERILAEFRRGKQESKDRLAALKSRLTEQARFCRAAMLQRVPRLVTAILRLTEQHKLLGRNILVAGTHAIYAYEARAGVLFAPPILATRDMDILWDTRPKLKLIGDDAVREKGLMGILKKADRSFEPIRKRGFRAVNRDGYMVDLIKPEPRRITQKDRRRMGENGDLEAAEIKNLQWLISSPKFHQIVIGDDGYPAEITAPDPRAFALHKLWLAQQTDREPAKKHRDRSQGLAVGGMIMRHLPDYPFDTDDLRMFPKEVAEDAAGRISKEALPPGFGD